MSNIKILDEVTINKIAAGEIIERPASVVKELVENSIDAEAKNIIIEIKDAGKSYIRVTDDGKGISSDEIDLAFKKHSTSKIETIEDLNHTISLGFRGEALASISTVGKMEGVTKSKESLKGTQIFLEDGKILEKNTVGCPKGTTMIVRDLFYNVPVRKKFLKSNITEARHISDLIYKLALGNPNISFKYVKDNKVIINTPGDGNLLSNIYLLLGKDFVDNLKKISYKNDILKIYGYTSNNIFYRGSRNHQYVYINNRYIKSNHISKTIENKYRSLIPINKFPVFILFIEIDPLLIDVNIHPTKQEVKFEEQHLLDIALEKAINSTIHSLYSVPKVELPEKKTSETEHEDITFIDMPENNTINKQNINESVDKKSIKETDTLNNSIEIRDSMDKYYNNDENISNKSFKSDETKLYNNVNEDKFPPLTDLKIIGVAFKTYIIAQDSAEDNLYLIDQHASHERVLYEKYREEYKNEAVVVQKLMTADIINLTNQEFNVFRENIELFNKLGFEVEEFGINTIALRGVPILFGKPNYKEIFFDILDNFREDIKNSYEMRLDKIIKIACSNAVKSGDNISEIEIYSLFEQLEQVENPYTCPHGRPTIIKVTKQELEKQFKRIM